MDQFTRKHAADVSGVLSGLDRVRFRGTQRWLANERGMMGFLWKVQVKLKEFKEYSMAVTKDLRRHVQSLAASAGREVQFLNTPGISKEDTARQIAEREGITEGLIGVLESVDPCYSYEVGPNAQTQRIELRRKLMKCKHQYLYFIHPLFGFGHLRLQTWFPFTMHVCLNGREWLSRELDRLGVGYVRRDNCLVAVEDVPLAQQLLSAQVETDWQRLFEQLTGWAFPAHKTLLGGEPMHYYWSADDTEWATDVMFRSSARLDRLYPQLIRHGLQTFSSPDVLRFLGRKTTATGAVHSNFAGEVLTDVKRRPEGIRIKHRLNRNSIKMYNKQGSVLRVETTITDCRDIKVYRRVEGEPDSPLAWRRLRKGVSDLPRRTQVSQAANTRYLNALAAMDDTTSLEDLAEAVCRPTAWQGSRVRGLRPLEADDRELLQAVIRGEFAINGFRNRDLRSILFPVTTDAATARRQSGNITRRLRILRAHGLITKVPTTHRYTLTKRGQSTISTFLNALQANAQQLNSLAA